jgi:hypothetical protein
MRNLFKGVIPAAVVAVSFALVVLILGVVALIRCPATDIPEVIRAFGAWLHVSVRVG